ncbi:hypothetical protein JCGZ_12567 [Jatropha curcas]|uniref:Gnk2-homologous domain-containing protein n=1 Tax=Jatropha curcas TaxID=180498 RepID=A0A067K786_JATCU|nr:cysteine-rich repeat secretory protein 38 [Jatropha curcas]KDP32106.1 hypothetical protein JCGZ_12567 [Jatropha curcas]
MAFSRFSYLLTLVLLLPTVFAKTDPLFYSCSRTENFTVSSSYAKSLHKLIENIKYLAPAKGFALGSLGQTSQDRPYGLTLCRGDISASDCLTCIAEASNEIRTRCPNNKQATIWYDNCLIKYSNINFFGQIDEQNKFYLLNVQNVSDPASFNANVKDLLSKLAENASVSPRMFAAGDMEIEGSKKVYGLAQCSRDLSSGDCQKCIDSAISELPSCCDGKKGGRVVGGSCTVRYEIYPFVNA